MHILYTGLMTAKHVSRGTLRSENRTSHSYSHSTEVKRRELGYPVHTLYVPSTGNSKPYITNARETNISTNTIITRVHSHQHFKQLVLNAQ